MKNFEELDIWKHGCQLAVDIYRETDKEPFARDFGLRDQIRDSAVSIPSNTSEGKERETLRELIRYLYIAKGSAAELKTQLYSAQKVGYLNFDINLDLNTRATTLPKNIGSFVRKLKGPSAVESADHNERRI
jgi:four helix bundle protein